MVGVSSQNLRLRDPTKRLPCFLDEGRSFFRSLENCLPLATRRKVGWMAKTIHQVVVHHAHRLHERIADRGAHEAEPPLLQVVAHSFRFWCQSRHLFEVLPVIDQGLVVHELPEIGTETAKLALNSQERLGIGHCRIHLQPIANNPWIRQESFPLTGTVSRYFRCIKVVEGGPIALATLQDRRPA